MKSDCGTVGKICFCLTVLVALGAGQAFAALTEVEWGGSSWVHTERDSANYVDIATDGTYSNVVYGANASGGVYKIAGADSWVPELIASGSYSLVVDNPGGDADNMFVAGTSGNLYNYWKSGTWSSLTASTATYVALVGGDGNNQVFGVTTGGAIHKVYYSGGYQIDPVAASGYATMVNNVDTGNIFAAKSAGGIDNLIESKSWGEDGYGLPTATAGTIYTAMALEANNKFYALDADGGIDQIYYSGGWQVVRIVSDTVYTEVVYDSAENIFAVKASGGVDNIYKSGTWQVDVVSATGTLTIAGEAHNNFFQADIPEPVTLATLLCGGILALLRRRGK